jgi:hypothetical protein
MSETPFPISTLFEDPIYRGAINSLGNDLWSLLAQSAAKVDVLISSEQQIIPRIDDSLTTTFTGLGAALDSSTNPPTLLISSKTLINHALELQARLDDDLGSLSPRQARAVADYYVQQSLVDLTLLSVPGLTVDQRQKIHDQFIYDIFPLD